MPETISLAYENEEIYLSKICSSTYCHSFTVLKGYFKTSKEGKKTKQNLGSSSPNEFFTNKKPLTLSAGFSSTNSDKWPKLTFLTLYKKDPETQLKERLQKYITSGMWDGIRIGSNDE